MRIGPKTVLENSVLRKNGKNSRFSLLPGQHDRVPKEHGTCTSLDIEWHDRATCSVLENSSLPSFMVSNACNYVSNA